MSLLIFYIIKINQILLTIRDFELEIGTLRKADKTDVEVWGRNRILPINSLNLGFEKEKIRTLMANKLDYKKVKEKPIDKKNQFSDSIERI